jgi:hypothetical protein
VCVLTGSRVPGHGATKEVSKSEEFFFVHGTDHDGGPRDNFFDGDLEQGQIWPRPDGKYQFNRERIAAFHDIAEKTEFTQGANQLRLNDGAECELVRAGQCH